VLVEDGSLPLPPQLSAAHAAACGEDLRRKLGAVDQQQRSAGQRRVV
jgi:hypothetical protein